LFCSIGDWASHITDILNDYSLDEVELFPEFIWDRVEYESHSVINDMEIYSRLRRYYGRLFLIVSELLVDFKDVFDLLKKSGYCSGSASNFYSNDSAIDFGKLKGFINNVFKHKTANIHKCDHHLALVFLDGFDVEETYIPDKNEYLIEIGCDHSYDKSEIEYVLCFPRISDILEFVVNCYQKLDTIIDDKSIIEICKTYGDQYEIESDKK